MFNVNIPKYKAREYVGTPLDVFNDTLNTYQARHDEALAYKSKIGEYLANSGVNEAEGEWIANKAADIDRQIEASADEGSYATALTTTKKLASSIASDRGLKERQLANAKYQEFIASVQKDDKIDTDTKAWVLADAKSKYTKMEDVVDENGVRVGSKGGFGGGKAYVENYDFNKLYKETISGLKPDGYDSSDLVWLDQATGQPAQAGATGAIPAFKRGSQVEQLSPEKIKVAFESAIMADPTARAAFYQDYQVQMWKTQADGSTSASPVKGKDGLLMTPQQYLDSLYNNRYLANSYRKVKSSVDVTSAYTKAMVTSKGDSKTGKSGSGSNDYAVGMYSDQGYSVNKSSNPMEANTAYKADVTNFRNVLADYGVSTKGSVDDQYNAAILAIQNSKGSDVEKQNAINELNTTYNATINSKNRFDSMKTGLTPDELEAIDYNSSLDAGLMSDSSNSYQSKLADKANKVFTKDGKVADSIYIDCYSMIGFGINSNNYAKKLKDKGYDCEVVDGKVKMSRETFITMTGRGETESLLPGHFKSKSYIEDSEGNLVKVHANDVSSFIHDGITLKETADAKLKGVAKRFKDQVTTIPIVASNIPASFTMQGINPTNGEIKTYNEGLASAIKTSVPTNLGMMVVDENGQYQEITDIDEKAKLHALIANEVDPKNIREVYNDATGTFELTLTLPLKEGSTAKGMDYSTKHIKLSGRDVNAIHTNVKSKPEFMARQKLSQIKTDPVYKEGRNMTSAEFGFSGASVKYLTDGIYSVNYSDGRVINMTHESLVNQLSNASTITPYTAELKDFANKAKANNVDVTKMNGYSDAFKLVLSKACILNNINGVTLKAWAATADKNAVAKLVSDAKRIHKDDLGVDVNTMLLQELNNLIK